MYGLLMMGLNGLPLVNDLPVRKLSKDNKHDNQQLISKLVLVY